MKQLHPLIWPGTTLLLLVLVFIYQQNLYAEAEVGEGYFSTIADEMRALPMSHGDWVGRPGTIPRSAVELLNANEAISISFRHIATGESVELVLVHCADARDLIGHYPPVCYPAHGWTHQSTEEVSLSGLAADENGSEEQEPGPLVGRELPCSYYRFERINEGYSHSMSVLNYMVLPDGRIGRSMDIVTRAASDLTQRGKGAMQVQVLFRDPTMTDKRRLEIADEFLDHIQPVLTAVWEAEVKG